ncbi:HAMP domain-containing sensor histidine kinase [Psychroserpens sp. SPM9]|uniref:sensor histidine kinase n=1 Tax=Psychroserpens sp. SPM9 TaxID=2975598 RepID=UPI0021A56734|nr:HAMP domain-containing sensor histidine kinase [Psychroserpens sp. SPM9]MDG5491839.1 HAMP domain-containing sensor histidine kinase [Psychroserpens sp. SPM9]
MKAQTKTYNLLRKTSTNFLLMSAGLMVFTASALYIYTRDLLNEEIEEELYSQVAFIEENLKKGTKLSPIQPVMDIQRVENLNPETLKDTLIFDPRQNEVELFKELTISKQINNEIYEIKARTLVIESEDLLLGIIISFLSILALAFIILFFINKSYNKRLWLPFFNSLNKLKNFSLESRQNITFDTSNINEFNELNLQLNTLFKKINADYSSLKQFTENVSHESQTPLAIIQAKIENIINENNINDKQYIELTSIQKDIKRLTQLNKHLILLAKIDNDQFSEKASVNFKHLLQNLKNSFDGISNHSIVLNVNENSFVKMNPHLAEILCNNLLSNAIKYSDDEQPIEVAMTDNILTVSNAGNHPIKNPEKIFDRFYKESGLQKSSGLGLAIVKKICALYDYKISYTFENQRHYFSIAFK